MVQTRDLPHNVFQFLMEPQKSGCECCGTVAVKLAVNTATSYVERGCACYGTFNAYLPSCMRSYIASVRASSLCSIAQWPSAKHVAPYGAQSQTSTSRRSSRCHSCLKRATHACSISSLYCESQHSCNPYSLSLCCHVRGPWKLHMRHS